MVGSSTVQRTVTSEEEISIKLFLHRSSGNVSKHRVRGNFEFDGILNFIANVWTGSNTGRPVVIEYVDEEGDVVCLSTAPEWKECLRVYREFLSREGRPLCLNVHRRMHGDGQGQWSDADEEQEDEQTDATVQHFLTESTLKRSLSNRAANPSVMPCSRHVESPQPPPPQYSSAVKLPLNLTSLAPPPPPVSRHEPREVVVTVEEEEEFVNIEPPVAPQHVDPEVALVPVAEAPPPAPVTAADPVPPPVVEEPQPAPLAALSPRSEATTMLQSVFPDMSIEEAHLILNLNGNNLQKSVAWKLGSA